MSVQEYINQDLPFFHITKMDNLEEILREGLLKEKTVRGVCVVRSDADDIIYEIIDCQLYTLDVERSTKFALLKLIPSKHDIHREDVIEHPRNEESSPLYNFIDKNKIEITEDDIVRRNLTIGNFREIRTQIVGLTDYSR